VQFLFAIIFTEMPAQIRTVRKRGKCSWQRGREGVSE